VPVRRLTAIARDDRLRALIEIQPGRPAFGAGLRMAVAVVAPLAAAIALGHLASGLMIAVGAMSPLEGFMSKADYEGVVNTRRLKRGVEGCCPFVDMPVDVFDHDNRVVDDEPDREHEAEQREHVDRIAERVHHGKGRDDRHRDRDGRDERRP